MSDGDEIKVYHTDPAKRDTDGDTLLDGEEIKIGLDPLNPATHGVPDGEYAITQTIDSNNDVWKNINKEGAAFSISVDLTAVGYAENKLTAAESPYANAIHGDATYGSVIDLDYDRENAVGSVTIRFEIKEDYAGYEDHDSEIVEMRGIRRYNVFHYFEEENMLLPVETFFDEGNHVIYTTTDELGTYCLMDMEQVFATLNRCRRSNEGSNETAVGIISGDSDAWIIYARTGSHMGRILMENSLELNVTIFICLIIIPLVIFDGLVLFISIARRKYRWMTGIALLLIITETIIIKKVYFPTYWKYPDKLIHNDIVNYRDVEEVYGPFDKEGTAPDFKAYYIYTDDEGNDHYYYIGHDTEGFVSYIEDRVL